MPIKIGLPPGTSPPSVADIAGLSAPIGMAAEITPLIPKSLKAIEGLAHKVLSQDYLGFDTLAEAKRAVLSHPDWAERWDVSGPMKHVVEAWKSAVKLGHLKPYLSQDLAEVEELKPQMSGSNVTMDDLRALIGAKMRETKDSAAAAAKQARSNFSVIPGGKPTP